MRFIRHAMAFPSICSLNARHFFSLLLDLFMAFVVVNSNQFFRFNLRWTSQTFVMVVRTDFTEHVSLQLKFRCQCCVDGNFFSFAFIFFSWLLLICRAPVFCVVYIDLSISIFFSFMWFVRLFIVWMVRVMEYLWIFIESLNKTSIDNPSLYRKWKEKSISCFQSQLHTCQPVWLHSNTVLRSIDEKKSERKQSPFFASSEICVW